VRADVQLGGLTEPLGRGDIRRMIITRVSGNNGNLNSRPSWSRGSGVSLS
jgi:hypothetical protein